MSLTREADNGSGAGGGLGEDLVLLALPGVQQFIGETRSLSDARAASEVYCELTAEIVRACEQFGRVIFPAAPAGSEGMPNRVVALFPAEAWAPVAGEVRRRAEEVWLGWVRQALGIAGGPVPGTPGMPQVHWVCVPPKPGGYAEQWVAAQALMAARRRVRDFPAAPGEWRQRALCSLGPRWPAEPQPAGLKEHEKVPLSAAAWVKRRWRQSRNLEGFPSTASVASARFRQAVLGCLGETAVRDAVGELSRVAREVSRVTQGTDAREWCLPGLAGQGQEPGRWFASSGGPWVYPERWRAETLAREAKADVTLLKPLAERGLKAAGQLAELMEKRDTPPPASYLAVIVQDLDDMGRFLSGESEGAGGDRVAVTAAMHRDLSGLLRRAGNDQRRALEDAGLLGLAVYAGGDDLLAFVPAVHALRAAKACHDALPPALPAASTAVCFFHYHASLRDALTGARELLAAAKGVDGKHGLGVGYLRRSGVRETSVQGWLSDGTEAIGDFGVFAGDQRYRLSPGLLADLEKDCDELARLSAGWPGPGIYQAELARLVGRHLAGDPPAAEIARAAAALGRLGSHEAAARPGGVPADGAWPVPAARVAVFLRQEAR